jgi:hypothetical protein
MRRFVGPVTFVFSVCLTLLCSLALTGDYTTSGLRNVTGSLFLNDVQAAPSKQVVQSATSVFGVPMCGVRQPNGAIIGPAHDPNKYHKLVERKPDGTVLCTYGHEHHDNPLPLNAVLGQLGAWYGPPGQQISYPWHTSNPSTGVSENAMFAEGGKHEGYKWLVRTNLVPAGQAVYFRNLRAEEHILGIIDYPTQFHSFMFEAQLCRVSDGACGVVHMGGLHNAGNRLGASEINDDYCVIPDGDPSDGVQPCVRGTYVRGTGSGVSNARIMAPLPDASGHNMIWYVDQNGGYQKPGVPIASFVPGMGTDVWGPVNPNNPSDNSQRYAPHYSRPGVVDNFYHATSIGTDAMALGLSGFPADSRGIVTFRGWTDRHGNVNPSCRSTSGLDCVPIFLDRVPLGPDGRVMASYDDTKDEYGGSDQRKDWDVILYRSDGTTIGDLVTYPN